MDEAAAEESSNRTRSIDILTDARHGWRKNSRQTDIVCIGERTHRVLDLQVVTSKDDPYAQRHERLGTERVYDKLTSEGLVVARHCHDNNASVTKYIRENHKTVINQLDNWHGLKSLDKHISKISKGTAKESTKTWHWQLKDKPGAIHTHATYSMKNCGKSEAELRRQLLNCVDHYQGIHTNCSSNSRCRWDPRYEPSKTTIDDPKAADLLRSAIVSSNLHKNAKLYTHDMSTAYVESFNNCLNVFQDKRIAFFDENYKVRSLLTVCYWNENVNRNICTPRQPSSSGNRRSLTSATYNFRHEIWCRYLQALAQ